MVDKSRSEETLPRDLQHDTPNSKVSMGKSKSRLKGRVNRRMLFQPEEQSQPVLPSVQCNRATPIKWSDAESHALATYIDGKHMAHKDMEFWKRAAIFIQNVSNTNYCRTGK